MRAQLYFCAFMLIIVGAGMATGALLRHGFEGGATEGWSATQGAPPACGVVKLIVARDILDYQWELTTGGALINKGPLADKLLLQGKAICDALRTNWSVRCAVTLEAAP